MKFLVDHQLPPALADWLIAKGHEADHLYKLGLDEADDPVIWDQALRDKAIIITKDRDFAERRLRSASGPSILWVRIGNSTKRRLLEVLERAWPAVEHALAQDAVVEVL